MLSGNVSIIRFNLMNAILGLILGVVGLPAAGETFPETTQSLQKELVLKYQALNERVKACSAFKKRRVMVTDKWLKNLPEQTQKIILFELYKKAQQRCAADNELAYINAIFELAVYGENQPLNEYIQLRRYDLIDAEGKAILEQLEQSELKRISDLPEYQEPFNLLSAFDK